MAQVIEVTEELKGKRADLAATEALPQLSRAYVHKLFEEERITLNGEPAKPGYKLRLGDSLSVNFEISEIEQIPDIDMPILYEDENVLVVDKPAGVISHARGRFWNEASVASFVRQKTGQEGERSGIVHRLDRVTSGVMVCAKNADTLSLLQKQFSQRGVKKSYVAIVLGHLKPDEAIIDMPLGRNMAKPQTFHGTPDGKPARTQYKVEKSFGSYDLVRLMPETGRTHQIRVHLYEVGHPIVGDHLYVGEEGKRLYLHAVSLEITLPGGERRVFESPLPPEFQEFMDKHHG